MSGSGGEGESDWESALMLEVLVGLVVEGKCAIAGREGNVDGWYISGLF